MTTMRMKTFKPNFTLAEQKALEFINQLENKELPVKLIRFKNIFDDLEIKTYSWYSRKMGLTIEKVCEDLGSNEGCCVYDNTSQKYRIYYNDTVENEGRKRWTLAHELGHYALKHHEISGQSILRRTVLPKEEYTALEKEANCFARNLLAPPHVIFNIQSVDPTIIQEICRISLEAAIYIHGFLKNGVIEYGRSYSKEYAEKLGFKKFLYNTNNRYYCRKCRCHLVLKKPINCPGCGNNTLSKTPYKLGVDFNMKYTGIEVDNKSRAIKCPKCDNEELKYDGDICMICNNELVNKCAHKYDYNGFNGEEYIQEESCGTILPGNARYCFNCGKESTFYQLNYLRAWNQDEIDAQRLAADIEY